MEEERTLEEELARLEEVVTALEDGSLSLEELFVLYEEGVGLVKSCSGKIDPVEKKMLQIDREGKLSEMA